MTVAGVNGLASGMNTGDIIDAMVNADKAGTRLVEGRRDKTMARRDAVRGFNTRLLSAQVDLANLRQSSTFLARLAASGNTGVLSATASSKAIPGSYQIVVDQEARAHQVSTAGFASSTSSLGTGTVVVQVGNGAATTITLDPANSSLEGLAAEINAKSADVSAQIVSDGSSTPFRLVLTSKKTGAASDIRFTADGLVGGEGYRLGKVTQETALGSTSTVAAGGFYSGADGPKDYLVQVVAGGAVDNAATTFRYSTDGGTTWSADQAATSAAATLAGGVTVGFSAGSLATGESFTVRPLQQLSAAQDAKVKYGSGGSYLSVVSATNTITDLVPGVTLSIAGPGSTTVSVSNDGKRANDAMAAFVTSYNAAISYLNLNSKYDPDTKEAGILISDTDMRRSLDSMTRTLLSPVRNRPTSLNTLGAVGVSLDRQTGLLTFDADAFASKLASDPDGVGKLFANSGTSSNAGVQYSTVSEKTDVSSPFAVQITQTGLQATVATTGSLAASTVIDGTNDGLTLKSNGTTYSVTLAHGTYTRQQLADQVQAAANASITDLAAKILVKLNGSDLDVRSTQYGSVQSIEVTGGTANAVLNLSTTAAVGRDVAGWIDGQATFGTGQVLSGVVGQRSEGLRLNVTATTPIAALTVDVTKGVAQLGTERLRALTDTKDGSVVKKEDGLDTIIDDMTKRIADMDARSEARRVRYQKTFAQMEKMIQQFQSQGNAITGQIAGFENMAASRAKG